MGYVSQPLIQGKGLLAKIDPCKNYESLVVKVSSISDHCFSLPFKFSLIMDQKDNWICYEEDSSLTLSLEKAENMEFSKCFDLIEFDDGENVKVLSEGNNEDVNISESKEGTLKLHHDGSSAYITATSIISCDLQYKDGVNNSSSVAVHLTVVIVVLVLVVIAVLTICVIRRKSSKEKIVTTDVNPTYGDNDYGYYYAETQLTDTNYEYFSELNENDETNRCEIKERNEAYYQKGRQ